MGSPQGGVDRWSRLDETCRAGIIRSSWRRLFSVSGIWELLFAVSGRLGNNRACQVRDGGEMGTVTEESILL